MSNVDWEGLKARWRLGNPIILPSEFPAILAAHERDQRVIEAAEKLNDYLLDGNKFDGDIPDEIYLPFKDALDKAKV